MENYESILAGVGSTHDMAAGSDGTTGGIIGGFESVAKFGVSSVVAAGTSLYNTGVSLGNALGGEFDEVKTVDVLAGFDDDMAKYYNAHAEGIEMTGFVVGSLVPGMAGVKVLKAGQLAMRAANAGKLGTFSARLTGILAPDVASATTAARGAMAASSLRMPVLQKAVFEALGKGMWQQTLEAGAFEIAALGAMSASPVLDGKSIASIAKDSLYNAALGGVVGGAIHGIGLVYGAKRAADAVDLTANTLFARDARTGILPGSKVVGAVDDFARVPAAPTAEDILLGKVPGLIKEFPPVDDIAKASGVQKEAANKLALRFGEARSNYMDDALNKTRSALVEAGADQTVTNHMSNAFRLSAEAAPMLDVQKIARLGAALEEPLGEAALKAGRSRTYMQIVDDSTGKAGGLFAEAPRLWRVADSVADEAGLAAVVSRNKLARAETANFADFAKYSELDADARYIKVSKIDSIDPAVEHSVYDIPMLKRAFELGTGITVKAEGATAAELLAPSRVAERLQQSVDEIISRAVESGGADIDSLAHRLDVTRDYIDGLRKNNVLDDLFANRVESEAYTQKLIDAGIAGPNAGMVRTRELPKFVALDNAPAGPAGELANEFVVDAMTAVKSRVAIAKQQADLHSARGLQMLADDLAPDIARLAEIDPAMVTRQGAGAGLLSPAASRYLSAAASAEHNGLVVSQMSNKAGEAASKRVAPAFNALRSDAAAATEFGVVKAKAQTAGDQYITFDFGDGNRGLVLRPVMEAWEKEAMAAADAADGVLPELTLDALTQKAKTVQIRKPGSATFIPVKSDVAYKAFEAHISATDNFVRAEEALDLARGMDTSAKTERLVGGLYVPPPNPKNFPFKAFVQDKNVGRSLAGRTTMIHAASEAELRAMMEKIPRGEYHVYTKGEAERFYASQGAFEYAETLHDARVNSDLASRGVMAPAYVQTDGNRLADELIDYHVGRARTNVQKAVSAKFANEFDTLREMGQRSRDTATSKFGKAVDDKLVQVQDPYTDVIKTTLNINKFSEFTGLYGVDQWLNNTADFVVRSVRGAVSKAKKPEDLDAIHSMLEEHGMGVGWMDAAGVALADHPAGTQALTTFVRRSNSILSALTLTDTLNAVNNSLGAALMRSNELRLVINGIRAGSEDAVGALSKLKDIDIGGLKSMSPTKLQIEATSEFLRMRKGHPVYEWAKEAGYIRTATDVQHALIDELTPAMSETAQQLTGKVDKAMALARKITGNDLAEELNRFTSAYVAKRIADIGVQAGVITEKEAGTVVSTFVNRVEGSLLASQKPIIFNGAIGSAVGLFQSYTFRLGQQMLRNVAEGGRKEAALMAGLQGTFYGMRGLPAFDAINQHVIGTMSSNPESRDAYDAIYAGAGKTGGDLLLYGIPSNILNTNLYTRGDINPRHPTIIPTNFSSLPVVGMLTKAFAAAGTMIKEGGETGNVGHALLTGLEHNGISRPVAGIGQLVKGLVYQDGVVRSTSSQDTTMFASGLYDYAQLSRLAGGRMLEESIAIDGLYRVQAYQARASDSRSELAQTLRQELQAKTLTQDKLDSYVGDFVRTGKKQSEFAKWTMSVIKNADKAEVDKVTTGLAQPYNYKMQLLMGGKPNY